MTPFFRRIRHRLANENSFLKYTRYAIGEIVLVVIGILIALQINNWNEQRKFKNLKSIYTERLINDLKQDTLTIHSLIKTLDQKQRVIQSLTKAVEEENFSEKLYGTIEDYFRLGWNMNDFTANKNTYSELSESGNMNVFQDYELLQKIKNYYVVVEQEEKGHLTNKDWIVPMDVALASEANAFEFDVITKALFQNIDSASAINSLLDQKLLLKRNAAGHYWLNNSLKRGIIDIEISAIDLIENLETVLKKEDK